jgi:hypothetical protein
VTFHRYLSKGNISTIPEGTSLPQAGEGGEEFDDSVNAGWFELHSEGGGIGRTSGIGERSANGLGLLGEGLGPRELSGNLYLGGCDCGFNVASTEGRLGRGRCGMLE